MHISFFDDKKIKPKALAVAAATLSNRNHSIATATATDPEFSLKQYTDDVMHARVYEVASHFKKVKHVVLVGIGGSSLGVEAVHSVVGSRVQTQLHILDTVSAHELQQVLTQLASVKSVTSLALCIISKSGTTTETIANAEVLLQHLHAKFGDAIYKQTVCIGDDTSPLQKLAKKKGAHCLLLPKEIGGRYSVCTPVGLLPLLLLGHDIESFLAGQEDAAKDHYVEVTTESAVRLAAYLQLGYTHYNAFMFDTRLVRLGKWYRQLLAESIGKEKTLKGKNNTLTFVPTISTPVELHSTGQLYFSGVVPVYTDFVSFDDDGIDYEIPRKAIIASALKQKSLQEISAAMYGGVIGAYQEQNLPYRATLFDTDIMYSLGLFMSMRMHETMLLGTLLGVNVFDQPNVELYKQKTKAILGIS